MSTGTDIVIIMEDLIKIEIPGGRIHYLTIDQLIKEYIRLVELEDKTQDYSVRRKYGYGN